MIGGRAWAGAEADRGSVRTASGALVALPVGEQEARLVEDLLGVLVGCEGRFVYASTAQAELTAAARPHRRKADVVAGALPPVRFALRPLPSAGEADDFPKAPAADPSLAALTALVLPLGEQYLALAQFVHARLWEMAGGRTLQALCAALRACLQEHLVSIAQLQQQQRTKGLALQQLWYFLQPTARALATLHELVLAIQAGGATDGAAGADKTAAGGGAGEACRGGALLRLLHERRAAIAGDDESVALYDYLLRASATPFFEMLRGWVYRGECDDPYGEFLVREAPSVAKEGLTTEYACAYWQKRFTLAPAQVRRGRATHASPTSRFSHI